MTFYLGGKKAARAGRVAWRLMAGLCWLAGAGLITAAEKDKPGTPDTAQQYRLYPRDLVHISVLGEADVNVDRRVDGGGEINVPMLGNLKVQGQTVAEIQTLIQKRYVAEEIFNRPEVMVAITEYSPKEIMVLGQVNKQGKEPFPPEAVAMPIVEAITEAGGFTRIAKSEAVRVTRKDQNGADQSFIVNVEKMIDGRASQSETFLLQAGDVIFVPERAF